MWIIVFELLVVLLYEVEYLSVFRLIYDWCGLVWWIGFEFVVATAAGSVGVTKPSGCHRLQVKVDHVRGKNVASSGLVIFV